MMTLALMFDTADPGTVQAAAGRIAAQADPACPPGGTPDPQPCRKDRPAPQTSAPRLAGDALHGARLDHVQAALRRLMGGAYSGPTMVAVATGPRPAGSDTAAGQTEPPDSLATDETDAMPPAARVGSPASGGVFCLHLSNGDGDDLLPLSAGDETVVMLASGIKAFAVEREADSLTLRFGAGSSITFDGLARSGAIGVARWSEAPEVTLLYTPPQPGTAD